MTNKSYERVIRALEDASELISSRCQVDITPEDVGEEDEKGLKEYAKACKRASKKIQTLADRYKRKIKWNSQ